MAIKTIDTSNINWTDYFIYDESSPTCLRWAANIYNRNGIITPYGRLGYVAGKKNGERSTVLLSGRRYKVPRVIWELLVGRIPNGMVVDHKDGNPLNNQIENLRVIEQQKNTRNAKKRTDNSSGITGVSLINNGKGNYYWSSRYCSSDGTIQTKHFSINKLGDSEAFRQACEYRAKMIEELNAQGAGYTEDHGKRLTP